MALAKQHLQALTTQQSEKRLFFRLHVYISEDSFRWMLRIAIIIGLSIYLSPHIATLESRGFLKLEASVSTETKQ